MLFFSVYRFRFLSDIIFLLPAELLLIFLLAINSLSLCVHVCVGESIYLFFTFEE